MFWLVHIHKVIWSIYSSKELLLEIVYCRNLIIQFANLHIQGFPKINEVEKQNHLFAMHRTSKLIYQFETHQRHLRKKVVYYFMILNRTFQINDINFKYSHLQHFKGFYISSIIAIDIIEQHNTKWIHLLSKSSCL